MKTTKLSITRVGSNRDYNISRMLVTFMSVIIVSGVYAIINTHIGLLLFGTISLWGLRLAWQKFYADLEEYALIQAITIVGSAAVYIQLLYAIFFLSLNYFDTGYAFSTWFGVMLVGISIVIAIASLYYLSYKSKGTEYLSINSFDKPFTPVVTYKSKYPDRSYLYRIIAGDFSLVSAYFEFFVFLPILAGILLLAVAALVAIFSTIAGKLVMVILGALLAVYQVLAAIGAWRAGKNCRSLFWKIGSKVFIVIYYLFIIKLSTSSQLEIALIYF